MSAGPAISSRGELPDGGLARIKEALARAWSYLDEEARQKLSALQDEDTLWALAAVIAIWGGFQITPVAWIADSVLLVVGAYTVTADVVDMLGGAADAVLASTPEQFDQASRRISRGIVGFGVDAVAGLLGGALLGALRSGIRAAKGSKLATRFFQAGKADTVLTAAKSGGRLATAVAADVAVGAAVGIGAVKAAPVASQAWNDTKRALNIGLPVVGGLLLVGGIWAYSRASRGKR